VGACRRWGAGVVAAAMIAVGSASADCRDGISPETAQRVFTVLNHPPDEAPCRFEGVATEHSMLSVRWSRDGVVLPPLLLAPADCGDGGTVAGAFALRIPPEIAAACPSVGPRIDALLREIAGEAPAGERGRLDDPLLRGTEALIVAALALALLLGIRGIAGARSADVRWITLAIAGFVAALVFRAAVPFSLGNWYSEVLDAGGPPPWMRFGPGPFALELLARDCGVWGPRALRWMQLVAGAAAVPLLVALMRELRLGLVAAAAGAVLLVVAPLHARLSASTSEHVPAATLCLALLIAWMRTLRTRTLRWLIATLFLFPLVCAMRVDMTVAALLVLVAGTLWSTECVRRASAVLPPPRRRAFIGLAALGTGVAASLAIVYWRIVIPAHHPMAEAGARGAMIGRVLPQFWVLARTPPHWVSLGAVLLGIVGAVRLAARRPLLLGGLAVLFYGSFVALGRGLESDELVGARYFLWLIPLALIPAGCGLDWILRPLPPRARTRVAPIALVALAFWAAVDGRAAYAARYAFQDEYSFARDALARLPDGCTVFAVPLRPAALLRDLDCCLDLHRSPLVLDFPRLRFRELPDDPARAFTSAGCVAYYESSACHLTDPRPQEFLGLDRTLAFFDATCGGVHRVGHLELLAEARVSPRATVNFFHGEGPPVRLYRWTR
jgi:hypothetical protein